MGKQSGSHLWKIAGRVGWVLRIFYGLLWAGALAMTEGEKRGGLREVYHRSPLELLFAGSQVGGLTCRPLIYLCYLSLFVLYVK